ncbi:MAG: 50S ribosomal protein L4 [Rhodospirillales bacterium]|nr:50S ribosomal protein L4 [Alphaproteobacteria bacterium]MCB9986487.1 50S ribosomal protein L4 [Rhodospirillales bacterium]USO06968.1 MAG: 50S ribosomal protein L4 [Rhodospirillales bacterium]
MKVAVKTLDNKAAGDIALDAGVFGVPVRQDILLAMVRYQLAKRRAGTHDTKGVSEVSGTGKKPYKQKGTGNARQGSLRSPQFRGGAVIFGPTPRDHAIGLPKKVRKLALRTALSAKLKDGKLLVLDTVAADSHKTKAMAAKLATLGIKNAVVVTAGDMDVNFARATSNIPMIDVLGVNGANVYDILRRDTLVLTKDAVGALTEKLKD